MDDESTDAEYDLSLLVRCLTEADIEKQISAVDQAVNLSRLLAAASVRALKNGPNHYFVAQRLPGFGSLVVEPLTTLLGESDNAEVKILASLVLLRLGSRVGVTTLLDAVLTEPADRYAPLIATNLAASGITEAGGAFVARLRQYKSGGINLGRSFESNLDKDFVVSLLHALNELNIDELPLDLRLLFASQETPIEVRSVLKKLRTRAAQERPLKLRQDQSLKHLSEA